MAALVRGVLVAAVGVGYAVERHYLANRYEDPSFSDAGAECGVRLGAGTFSGARIATTSTRQYPLFGTDLSNRVQYVGEETGSRRLEGAVELPLRGSSGC